MNKNCSCPFLGSVSKRPVSTEWDHIEFSSSSPLQIITQTKLWKPTCCFFSYQRIKHERLLFFLLILFFPYCCLHHECCNHGRTEALCSKANNKPKSHTWRTVWAPRVKPVTLLINAAWRGVQLSLASFNFERGGAVISVFPNIPSFLTCLCQTSTTLIATLSCSLSWRVT